MKIAFFDSGMGGLSVLHDALKILPQEEFIFYADEDNVPYGTKSREEVLRFVDAAFKFLIEQGVGAIVVACNTATSVAVKEMREKYSLPIIGMEPALKVALDSFPDRKVLVTATAITITGEKILKLIEKLRAENLVELRALPRLVEFAERQEFKSAAVEEYLRGELASYDFEEFSSLVLGCTHFNYFKDTLRKILPPHIKILDGNAGTINELIRRTNLKSARSEKLPSIEFYYSGRRVTDSEELSKLKKFLSRLDEVEAIR
ncbi:MAG: glutamate racemase [Selenomonadaceae bacterium]|nr:glutamate racemase [Selenomonadaceae bacterium]